MQIRVLGPLEVLVDDRRVSLPAGRLRALLGLLALEPGRGVSLDRLVDGLWPDDPPASAVKVVQQHVSRLRRLLPPDRLLTRGRSYLLAADGEEVDAEQFESLVRVARRTAREGDAEAAARTYREALALWRGAPLEGLFEDAWAPPRLAALGELRLVATEECLEAELTCGRDRELLPELEALTVEQPLRERLRGQAMLALYRCGRQADALALYRDTRRMLVDVLGIEPGAELQELHQKLLDHDPDVAAPLRAHAAREAAASARSSSPAATRVVGRERELAWLRTALTDARAGHPGVRALAGEPGIGKTRLASELADEAARAGVRVLWGRSHEEGGAPAYWPFVQALRAYLRERGPEELRRQTNGIASALAEILPELSEKLGGLPPLAAAEPQEARFRLFDAVTSFLRHASTDLPLVLVLDDLHWADPGTLALLQFLARELAGTRLLVVGTYRDLEVDRRHPLATTLAELTRAQLFERLALHGLSELDVGDFIRATTGSDPHASLVHAVYTQTEGNPLFVTEVVRLLVQEGELEADRESWSIRIPDGVREVIERRLGRLSERCQEALRTAALLGREFTLQPLTALLDSASEDRILDLMDEALAARIVEELPRSVGRYQFTHALVQDTLTEAVSATRRAHLHARIAQTLERLYGEQADRHAGELAYHCRLAGELVGSTGFVRYALLAGHQASAAHAHEQARDYYQQVLAAHEEPDARRAEALAGLAVAQLATSSFGDTESALETEARAFDLYLQLGDRERAVALAAQPFRSVLSNVPGSLTATTAMLERALTLVRPDSHQAALIAANHGFLLVRNRDYYERGVAELERARATAQTLGDAALEAWVLRLATAAAGMYLQMRRAVELIEPAVELAQRVGDEHLEAIMHVQALPMVISAADGERAHLHRTAGFALSDKLYSRSWLAILRYGAGAHALLEGDWSTAREQCELGVRENDGAPLFVFLGAYISYLTGDFESGARQLERLQRLASGHFAGCAALCDRIAGRQEFLDRAAAAAGTYLAEGWLIPQQAHPAEVGHALVAVARADADDARRWYARLIGYQQECTVLPFSLLSIERLLGIVATAMGAIEPARAHFDNALATNRRAGYCADYAWTAYDYAQLLRDHDPGRGDALEEEALSLGRELGMPPLIERVLERRGQLGA